MDRLLRTFREYWFPVALLGLFVLAIPGVVLTILGLANEHASANAWLEENLGISFPMNLPPAWTVVLLFLPLLLVLLYFLKLKRRPIQVPSTFLWKKSIEDVHVNSLFQWLRSNILLVLQVLTVLFLIYAVLGLRLHGAVTHGKHYILMIDNSASMTATDVSGSRLEKAKQDALKEIDAASDNDWGMVIVFNSKATTLQTYTNNKGKLREAVRGIEPTERSTQIEEALTLAASLANPERSTEDVASQPADVADEQKRTMVPTRGISTTVHLFSDGRFGKLSDTAIAALQGGQQGRPSLLGNLNLVYHRIGAPGAAQVDNVGIIACNAIRYIDPQKKVKGDSDLQKVQVMVRVMNARPNPADVNVLLEVFVDGQSQQKLRQRLISMPPRVIKKGETPEEDDDEPGKAEAIFVLPPIDVRKNISMRASLENHKDAFKLDDEAFLALGATRKAKVLLIGPSTVVLDLFFDQEGTRRIAVTERMTLEQLAGEEYKARARSGDIDLVVFDRCAPAEEADMPLANTYFIGVPPPPWTKGEQMLKDPLLVPTKKTHPLLKHIVTLWDVRIGEAFVFDVKNKKKTEADGHKGVPASVVRVLETTGQAPLLFTMNRGPFTDIVQTFPFESDSGDLLSNWPVQLSFPLFLRNLVYHYGNVDDSVRGVSVPTGETLVLRPEAGAKYLDIRSPAGSRFKLDRGQRPDFLVSQTDRTGIYDYRIDGKDERARSFAVNLLDPSESLIEPREVLRFGGESVTEGEDRPTPRDVWKWILVLALILLSVEWLIYIRRIAV